MIYFEEEKFFFSGKYFCFKSALPWDTCSLCDLRDICENTKRDPNCSATTYVKKYETFL